MITSASQHLPIFFWDTHGWLILLPFPFHPCPHVWAQHEKSQLLLLGGVLYPRPWAPKSGRIYSSELWSFLLAHLGFRNIVIDNHEFGLSENEPSDPFYYSDFDGIMEMAYPGLVVRGTPAFNRTCCSGTSWPNPLLQLLLLLGKNSCPGRTLSNEAL